MILQFTDEQRALRESVSRFLSEHSNEAVVRRLMETPEGYDPKAWQIMAEQIGLQAMIIPEEYGGAGFSWAELGITLEAMGESLYCGPFLASAVLATSAILESADETAMQRLLPGLADGSRIGTMVLNRGDDTTSTRVEATEAHDGWRVSGRSALVLDAQVADFVIVSARTDHGDRLFVVETDTDGCLVTPRSTLDQTRKLADVSFNLARATPLGHVADHGRTLSRVYDLSTVALALEQVGGAQAALDMSVEYMKVRVQFGQPIGAFQALKHMAADVLVEVENARSAAYYAMFAAASDSPHLPAAAALAGACCTDAFVTAAHQNVQFHGGMGFTWEVPAHLYFKRARADELLLDDPSTNRDKLAERLGF